MEPTVSEGQLYHDTSNVRRIRSYNTWAICIIMLMLMFLGLSNLYSATSGGDFFYSQLKNLIGGLVLFCIFAWIIPPNILNSYAYWLYGFVCVLLLTVLAVGTIAGGSQRWIRIGPISGQPSEFAKLTVAVIVARFFYINRSTTAYGFKDLWWIIGLVGLIFALIFPQPDLGTAGVCLLVALVQIAFVRIDKKTLWITVGLGLTVGIFAWFILLHDYQRLRVLNLLNPQMDPTGSGYNSLQSLIAIGSGNLTGKGYFGGTQTQLQFLPARHTDFIFSVFAEEHGFLGAMTAVSLFASLVYIGLLIAKSARDTFSSLLAIGISAIIFVSFVINVSMVVGLFPVVGVPLPFFSHGGTALLMMCSCLGILVAIDRQNLGIARKSKSLSREIEQRRGARL